MKKYLLLILLFSTLISFSQNAKYRIINFTEVERSENGEKFSESKKPYGYFEFDFERQKLTIPTLNELFLGIDPEKMPVPTTVSLSILSQRSFKDSEKNKYLVIIGMFRDGNVYTLRLIDYAKPKTNGVKTEIVIEGNWLYTFNVTKV